MRSTAEERPSTPADRHSTGRPSQRTMRDHGEVVQQTQATAPICPRRRSAFGRRPWCTRSRKAPNPADFLRHFPPQALMTALDIARDLRARILSAPPACTRRSPSANAPPPLRKTCSSRSTKACASRSRCSSGSRVTIAFVTWTRSCSGSSSSRTILRRRTATSPATAARRSASRSCWSRRSKKARQPAGRLDAIRSTRSQRGCRKRAPQAGQALLQLGRSCTALDETRLLEIVPLTELLRLFHSISRGKSWCWPRSQRPASFAPEEDTPTAAPPPMPPASRPVPAAAPAPAIPAAPRRQDPPAKPDRKKGKRRKSRADSGRGHRRRRDRGSAAPRRWVRSKSRIERATRRRSASSRHPEPDRAWIDCRPAIPACRCRSCSQSRACTRTCSRSE